MSEVIKFRLDINAKAFEVLHKTLRITGSVVNINGCVIAMICIFASSTETFTLQNLDLDDGEYVSSHPMHVKLSQSLSGKNICPVSGVSSTGNSYTRVESYFKLPSKTSQYPIKGELHYTRSEFT